MWKNIFLESCILSLLVFGGFYINANFMKEKITDSEEKVRIQTSRATKEIHLSGNIITYEEGQEKAEEHISGNSTPANGKTQGARPLGMSTR